MSSSNRNQTDFSVQQYLLGLSGMLSPLAIVIAIILLWPDDATSTENYVLSGEIIVLSYEQRVLLIVALSGALGSIIHVATSFATFVGNKTFVDSWTWWYVLRVPIGMSLAIIVYFTIRGGGELFPPSSGGGAQGRINLSSFAALAGLTGMFSRQATDKLKELFDALLQTQENAKRRNKFYCASIAIKAVEPGEITVGQPKPLTITGENFDQGVIVLINDQVRITKAEGSNSIRCKLEKSDVEAAGKLVVTVIPSGEHDGQFERRTVNVVKAGSVDGQE
ncbi:MAG: IPT/TIG domain-containing protein [Pseudomonadota bacterium]